MKVKILRESFYDEAMLALSLNRDQQVEKMPEVAARIYDKDDSHSKFLRFIKVVIDITAPRRWWQQMDTYSIGVDKSSQSRYVQLKKPLKQENFVNDIPGWSLRHLNTLIRDGKFDLLEDQLPESFLQRRLISTNYQTLRRIVRQRMRHRSKEWHVFIPAILDQIEHKEFFKDLEEMYCGRCSTTEVF